MGTRGEEEGLRLVSRRAAWWQAVLVGWAATTIAIGVLIAATGTQYPPALIITQAIVVAAIPCVVLGGPAAAVALRLADRQGIREASLRGWAVGVGGLIALVAVALVAGAAIAGMAVLIVLATVAAEVVFALRLYRRNGPHLPADLGVGEHR